VGLCKILREESVSEFKVSDLSPYTEYVVTLKDGRKITAHTTGMLAELIDDPGFVVDLDELASIREVGEVA